MSNTTTNVELKPATLELKNQHQFGAAILLDAVPLDVVVIYLQKTVRP